MQTRATERPTECVVTEYRASGAYVQRLMTREQFEQCRPDRFPEVGGRVTVMWVRSAEERT